MSADPSRSSDPAASADGLLRPHDGRKWCAIHTRARHEKKVAGACQALRVPHYLPLRVSRTFSGGKTNTFHVPMFPGYVFASLAPGQIGELKRTNSVAQKIEPRDEAPLISDLLNVRAVEVARVELEINPTFRSGQRVVVVGGPLAGVAGTVVRFKNRSRLQVAIEAINQAIVIDVPAEQLVPAE
jgi:transcriptional antiterminator RfaH